MTNYTVQQINSMNSADLKQAAITLGVDFKGLSDVALKAQLDDKIQSALNGQSTSSAQASSSSAPINLINGKSPEYLAALKAKYEKSIKTLDDSKTTKSQYENVFAEAKAIFGKTDPKNSTLNAAKADFDKYNESYLSADQDNTNKNREYFEALT